MTTTTTRRETVDAKAFRLKGHVRWLTAAVATVVGDHGEYRVERFGSDWRCNCRWGTSRTTDRKHCSHVLAAALCAPPTQLVPPESTMQMSVKPMRQPADQSIGDCSCRLVNPAELYYNRSQCTVIHRICGCPWPGRRKSPIRISSADPTAPLLLVSA